MRHRDDPVRVQLGLVAGREGPVRFCWRGRWYAVADLATPWLETADWWDGVAARAARGERVGQDRSDGDLLSEQEVWRLEASPERGMRSGAGVGVYELVHRWSDASWRLRAVLD